MIVAVGVGAFFLNQRRASQEQEFEIIREAEVALDQIAATVTAAEKAPFPGIPEFLADVQDIGAPTWPA